MKIYLIHEAKRGVIQMCSNIFSAAYYLAHSSWNEYLEEIYNTQEKIRQPIDEVLKNEEENSLTDFLCSFFNGKYGDKYEIHFSLSEEFVFSV